MIIQPKIRGFICTAAHPAGCHEHVKRQMQTILDQPSFPGPANALIVGASTGYGLSSRIALAFGANCPTIGVFFEKPAHGKRTASAGWYNSAAFESLAHDAGLYATSINGDAFSVEIKAQVAQRIRQDFGKLDCLIYSLASPRRQHPDTAVMHASVLKPVGQSYSNKTVDPMNGKVHQVNIEAANQDEIDNTVAVMGGDDWARWVQFLLDEDLLAENFTTIAYSYIGPELTFPIYTHGTIGLAKEHLHQTADQLNRELQSLQGRALISVNKALVTQSSSAIPVVPLYMSILFKLMAAEGTNEHCIEQMHRLFSSGWLVSDEMVVDDKGRIRLDDLEMAPHLQQQVAAIWPQIDTDNVADLSALDLYQQDFYHLFGFGFDNIDYTLDIDPDVSIPSLMNADEKP